MGGIVDFWKKYQLRPMKEIFKTTTLGGHPEKNLAIAAALIGGGTLLPGLLGLGGTAAAAGGLGEAAIGGAAAGAGGTFGGTAGMFGAAPGMASGLLGGSAITPAFTSGLAGLDTAAMGAGGMSMFGPSAAEASSLAALSGPGAGMTGSWMDGLRGLNWDKGMKGLQMANDFTKQGQQQPQIAPMPRPQAQAPEPLTGNPDLDELRKRLALLNKGIYGGLYV